MSPKSSPVCVYDFRYSADGEHGVSQAEVTSMLRSVAKHWAFQKERGDGGYLHWQGRMSLVKKRRPAELKAVWASMTVVPLPPYIAPTAAVDAGGGTSAIVYAYATKADTRVLGPFTDADVEVYIPRQYRGLLDRLYPWQRAVLDSADDFNDRRVNVLFCEHGAAGKSTVAALGELCGRGLVVPPINDADKLVAAVHGMCADAQLRNPSPVFIDLPRSADQTRMGGIYSAIEQIKNGMLYDVRHHFSKWWIDSPSVWVFTNTMPDMSSLSRDRWRVFRINAERNLEIIF